MRRPEESPPGYAPSLNKGVGKFSLRERLLLWAIANAALILLRLIGPTLRFRLEFEPGCTYDGVSAGQAIYCFWHRYIIPAAWRFRNRDLAVMTSLSFDGEYIARFIRMFGFRAVRGSSSRGGVAAFLDMCKELEAGYSAAFTIDGPRGPIYVAKQGPILLAQKTGCAITCFNAAVEKAWVLRSWDRMIIPKPFSRVAFFGAAPITVPADATPKQMDDLHRQMQATLERCRLKAEELLR